MVGEVLSETKAISSRWWSTRKSHHCIRAGCCSSPGWSSLWSWSSWGSSWWACLIMVIVFPLFHNSPNSWLGEDYGRCWSVSVLPCHLSSTTTLLSYSMHTQCHVPLLKNYWNILPGFPLWYQVKDMNRSVFKLNLGMKWHISRTLSLCKTPYNLVIWPPQM